MNILVIPSWYENNKNKTHGSFFKEQAKSLADRGHNVYVLYVDIIRFNEIDRMIFTKKYDCYKDNNLNVYRKKVIKIPRTQEIYVARNVKNGIIELYEKYIKDKLKIDVIHAHSFIWGGYAAVELGKHYNIPVMTTEHYSGYGRNLFTDEEEKIIRYSMNSTDRIVSVSSGLKNRISKYTDKDILVIPNMVDNKIFNFEPTKIKKEKFTFFTVAYLSEIKGIDILLKAFKHVVDKNPNCELIIGGDGVEKGNLEGLCKKLNLTEQVTFLGALNREQVSNNMKKCDCFVLPSRYETFGVVYIEALSCGKPVIGTNTDAISDIINEDNGIIVEKEDVGGLIEAMTDILKNKSRYCESYISEQCINKFGMINISKKIECELSSISSKGERNDE